MKPDTRKTSIPVIIPELRNITGSVNIAPPII